MDIVFSHFITLDGVIQAPGGPDEDTDGGFAHGGWSMPYFDMDVMGPEIDAVLEKSTALLFGRRTWSVMASAWPDRAGDPFSDKMNSIKKYVASRTLGQDDLTWENSHLLDPADAIGAVRRLKDEEEGQLQVMGNSSISNQLVEAGLVDEYNLMVSPLILGGGKGIFPADGVARKLELVDSKVAGTGVLILKYRTIRD